MYVSLDSFNYDELIPLLTNILGEDTPLTMESISKAFNDVIARSEQYITYLDPITIENAPEHVASWIYNTCNLETISICTSEDFVRNLCDTLYLEGESVEPGYERLYKILDVYFQDPKRSKSKDGVFLDPTIGEMNKLFTEAYQILAKYQAWCETPEEEALRKMLFEPLTNDEMADVEFDIVGIPGKTVSCGNALITFPLILAKVTCYET